MYSSITSLIKKQCALLMPSAVKNNALIFALVIELVASIYIAFTCNRKNIIISPTLRRISLRLEWGTIFCTQKKHHSIVFDQIGNQICNEPRISVNHIS
jgi:hypothetical protein